MSPPKPEVSPVPRTPNMPRRSRVGASRVPPSGGGSPPPPVCPPSPSRGGSPPRARCSSVAAPLASADDCFPPVGSWSSLDVPVGSVIALLLRALGLRGVLDRRRDELRLVPARGQLGGPLAAQWLVHDLRVDLEDRVHEHLRSRGAAREVHVDGHDVVDALDD